MPMLHPLKASVRVQLLQHAAAVPPVGASEDPDPAKHLEGPLQLLERLAQHLVGDDSGAGALRQVVDVQSGEAGRLHAGGPLLRHREPVGAAVAVRVLLRQRKTTI